MKLTSTSIFKLAFAIAILWSSMSFAQQQNAVDIALRHVEENRKDLKLTENDLSDISVSDLYTSRHNGVTHVYLNQQHQDIKVLHAITNVNILPNGEVLNMGNRFVSDLQSKVNSSNPAISASDAVKSVLRRFQKRTDFEPVLLEKVSDRHFIFEKENIALEPVSVKLVYQALEDKTVRLSWNVELYELSATNWWNARVDAHTGEVLKYHNQVIHCDFNHQEHCDHAPAIAKSNTNTKNLLAKSVKRNTKKQSVLANSYNVFPVPVESPIHGDRNLEVDPADATASPFGWHDIDGMAGAEYTITRGNNVHAYQDILNKNQSIEDEPDGGASLDFDFPLDLNAPPYTQAGPAVVNLFYWNNIMHDIWYQYGFDEASGNFQVNNYGNGGAEGDPVRAEALDGSGRNNANFGTGGDGSGGRMQMYIWTDEQLPDTDPDQLVVTEPMGVAGDYLMVFGGFGDGLVTTPIISEVVLADDGVGVGSDVCEDLINGAELDGKIAMIDRGDCEFGAKILKAENAGALAVIICNNVAAPATIVMGAGAVGDQVSIPGVMMSLQDCNTIKMGLPGLTVELISNINLPLPGPNGIDGDFDNGIIVHEYGHGVSIRLTGGPSQGGGCLSRFEQQGEGWSDWLALALQTTKDNFADEKRGIGTYALEEPITGDGIRTFPYSRNMNTNPHTYADIRVEAVPHGVGSVWAVMLWDLYWNLVDEYDFDEDFYKGTGGNNIAMQLVIDGMKLQPCNPSFLDARDAILKADEANYAGANKCLIWETFARRGLGFSARPDGLEAFDLPDACDFALKINKTALEEVDAGSTVTYTLEIKNDTPDDLTGVSIADLLPEGTTYVDASSSCANATVANGILTIAIGDLSMGASMTCTYQLMVADDPYSILALEDNVENGTDNWVVSSNLGNTEWRTNNSGPNGSQAWYVENVDAPEDQRLTTEESFILTGDNPALSFWHQFDSEDRWDGGVVEITTNDGQSWSDLGSDIIRNGYNLTLNQSVDNPLATRPAFSGRSGGYIHTLIDLSDYTNEEIKIRFRFGSDGRTGYDGWSIDNIRLYENYYAITNEACVAASGGDERCAEAESIVFGMPTNVRPGPDNQLNVSIFPNPAEENVFVTIENPANSPATIKLMGVEGRLLLSKALGSAEGSFELDLSAINAGIYLLEVETEDHKIVRKLVIQ